jgi:hypothetical protein
MADPPALAECTGFQWDGGNSGKNLVLHNVSDSECEQTFFNRPRIVSNDKAHSQKENRHFLLGQTDTGRPLFLVFTIRGDLIRVISARDMTDKEFAKYERKS